MVTLRDRLIREALADPQHNDLTLDQIETMVDEAPPLLALNGSVIPRDYPWWYGQLVVDRPKKTATEAQREALTKAREKKRELNAPYIPEINERPIGL